MDKVEGWLRKYVTLVGASAATVLVFALTSRGVVTVDRAVGPVVFAWMLAFHAWGNRLNTERHQQMTTAALRGQQYHSYGGDQGGE